MDGHASARGEHAGQAGKTPRLWFEEIPDTTERLRFGLVARGKTANAPVLLLQSLVEISFPEYIAVFPGNVGGIHVSYGIQYAAV